LNWEQPILRQSHIQHFYPKALTPKKRCVWHITTEAASQGWPNFLMADPGTWFSSSAGSGTLISDALMFGGDVNLTIKNRGIMGI
jgi:hypothetical protein